MGDARTDLIDQGADLIFEAVQTLDRWLDAWHAAEALVKAGWGPPLSARGTTDGS